MDIEIGDVVLCNVEKIVGTTVFVNIENAKRQGVINFSEIAPGRIRNIRDYVVPKKSIVCKVLKITGETIELSLRRVTQKEQKEIREKYKQEKSCVSILKSVLGEKSGDTIKRICEKPGIITFLNEAKKDSKELEKTIGKENTKKVLEILNSQKQKIFTLKKEIELHTTQPDGINKIKEILSNKNDVKIKYISAGRYSIISDQESLKKADQKLKETIDEILKEAKKSNIEILSK
ncbi:MAG: hypothetical protein WC812_03495 [Candidatus Pacearchaeota archaeon]|jgi:translation initiation factor 2 alpha subunit (eIF-2alpha)